jgi:hypothetical protein
MPLQPNLQRTLLTLGLCMLAFLFAFEAKLLWYGPPGNPSVQISAAKALRADSPALISHGMPAPDGVHERLAIAALAVLAAFSIAASDASPNRHPSSAEPLVLLSGYLVPSIDFRPPPAR